jgi:hypothetical protein
MSTVPVLIHFLGLCVFSSHIPGDPGQKVILPAVVYTDPRSIATKNLPAQRTGRVTPVPPSAHGRVTGDSTMAHSIWDPVPHVEDHVAIMMFPTASADPSSDWGGPPIVLPNTSYSYVKLTGDHLQLAASTALPDLDPLRLPHLRDDLCNKMTALNARFQPPAYTGAAAVVALPPGAIRACLPTGNNRVDTEATLNSAGDLVILANTGGVQKVLRLTPLGGRVTLVIANIPVSCLSGVCGSPQSSAINGVAHVQAYYGMGVGSTSCNSLIATWYSQRAGSPQQPLGCSMASLPFGAGHNKVVVARAGTGSGGVYPTTQMSNFECSNSQWP